MAASQDIEEIGSSSNSSCVIPVEYDRIMNEELPDAEEALIFRVPKALRDSNDKFYSPQFVSIGPFHYGKEHLKDLEKSKDEAVRRMQIRMQKTHPSISIQSFVDREILPKDKDIRKFYGEHISCSAIQLARMVTRDACFIFEYFVNYLRRGRESYYFYESEQKDFKWKYDAVFDVTYQNPMREGLMNDLFLFENQIPLWVLQDLLQTRLGNPEDAGKMLDELMENVLRCLSRHNIFMWLIPPSHTKCSHVLEVLYRGIVGEDIESYKDGKAYKMGTWHKRMKDFCREAVCKHWCKLSMQSPSSDTSLQNDQRTPLSSNNCIQIYFKGACDSIKAFSGRCCELFSHSPSSNTWRNESIPMEFVKLPTALELTRVGVSIYPVTFQNRPENIGSAIQWVRFDEKAGVLYLPDIMVTQQLYSVMSNIIAMELSTVRYFPSPMTQYVLLMDELIDSDEDVAVLRKEEVINNFLKSNQQAADFFNILGAEMIPHRGCKVVHEARRGLHEYTRRKYKILWSEFVSAYFSKPWLVVGSIGAVLLLLMTGAQVLCLFITCNP